jgi:phosphonate transport system substrate-binding protein
MKTWLRVVSLAVLPLLAPGIPGSSESENEPFSFGVIIHRSPTLTAQFWNPILGYVSERSGVPLRLKVARTGLEHAGMVGRGELHFLYSNHNFIKENETSGYRVFARPKEDPGKGQIVVLESSPIHALDDLQGQEMIFLHTAAFLGYHLPMDALLRKGIHVKPHFAGNEGRARRRRRGECRGDAGIRRARARRLPGALELGAIS